jgi:hypothetical protein
VTEQTLHEQLKELYALEKGEKEFAIGDYKVDVISGNLIIEIQTSNFSSIKNKLKELVKENRVRLVHPIAYQKWIVRLDKNKNQLSSRKSPRRGKIEDIFYELVYLPKLLVHPRFEIEVVMIDMEEHWIDDGKGSWRRRRWSIHDKKLLKLRKSHLFSSPIAFKTLIPDTLPPEFTSRIFSKESRVNMRLAQKMLYCFTKMKLVERNGKKGQAYLYKINELM